MPSSRTAGAPLFRASSACSSVRSCTDTGTGDYRRFGCAGGHDCGSPSQQPSLNAHRGHCHVWWRQSIAAPQRRQRSAGCSCPSTGATLAAAPDATLRRYAVSCTWLTRSSASFSGAFGSERSSASRLVAALRRFLPLSGSKKYASAAPEQEEPQPPHLSRPSRSRATGSRGLPSRPPSRQSARRARRARRVMAGSSPSIVSSIRACSSVLKSGWFSKGSSVL